MSQLLPTVELLHDELQRLSSTEERADFFQAHSSLCTRDTVDRLTKQATSLLRVDPRDAERLIATSLWLSEKIQDDYSRAKSHRALANLAHVRGNQSEALTHYALARTLFRATGADVEAAITASSSLQALGYLGRHEEANEEAEFARRIFEASGDRLRLARLNANYASILYHRERWAEAAQRYEDAYRDFLELGEKQDVAVCLGNMAVCHFRLHDFGQALEFYKRTRSYYEESGLTVLVAELDYNIAYLHYLRGQYTTALELYRAARAHHAELGIQHHVDLCALNEAEIYLELNLTAESADLARLAYSGFRDRGLVFESGKSLTILAIAQNRQGKSFLALDLLSKAQELFAQEKNELWVALLDLYKGSVFLRAGRPYEARGRATQADAVFRKFSLGTKSAACQVLLARLALQNREWDSAEVCCLAALADLSEVDAPPLAFQALYLLGEAQRQTGPPERAFESYLRSHEQLERMTGSIQTEEQRISAVDDKLVLYEAIADLLTHASIGADNDSRLFAFIEKAKSRTLTDLLAFRAYTPIATHPGRSKLADQVRQLREELNWYYRQIDLQEMRSEERSPGDVEELRKYSRKQEGRLIHTLSLLEQTDQELSSVQEAFSVDLATVQSSLPTDTTLVEYFVARGTVLASVVTRSSVEILPVTLLSTVDELRQLLSSSLSRALPQAPRSSTRSSTPSLAHLGSLYGELVAPIAHLLSSERLVVVPHGSLFYLPFHAFHTDGRFLAEQHAISYFPSATTHHFSTLKLKPPSTRFDLALSAPSPDADPASHELTRNLKLMFPSHVSLEDAQETASEPGEALGEARLIHLFADAQFRSDNPMFSSIVFGGRTVHVFDLFQMRLKANVMALSGCSPGIDADAKGNEMVGLVRGLLYAGARSVLATLWRVSPESWSRFVTAFFGRLKVGLSPEAALRSVVDEIRRDSPDPDLWAPFILLGDTR